MTKGETELELIPFVEGGELLVLWQLHRDGLGQHRGAHHRSACSALAAAATEIASSALRL